MGCSIAGISDGQATLYHGTIGGSGADENGVDIQSGDHTCYGVTLGSTNKVKGMFSYDEYFEYDYDQYKTTAWYPDGIDSKFAWIGRLSGTSNPNRTYSPMPSGHSEVCEMTFEYLYEDEEYTFHNWVDIPLIAYSGSTLQIDMWMKKDTNAMTITPRAVLLLYTEDEWTQVPLDEYVMTDNTDEQEYTLEYDNSSGVSDLALYLRVYGSNSSGKLYWTYSSSGSGSGSGGTASRGHPAIGSVGGMLQ